MALFLCVEIDQECIKGFGNDVLVLEDEIINIVDIWNKQKTMKRKTPVFKMKMVTRLWRKKTGTFLKRLETIPNLTMINVQIFSHDKVMTCYNMPETGLLTLVSLLAGTALKLSLIHI